jgi:hypothetical protein
MTTVPEKAREAFERHDAYSGGDGEYVLETTAFDSQVTATETDSWALRYTLTVRAPSLDSAVEEDVGSSLLDGWFETFERRLEDAPMAVRDDIELGEHSVQSENDRAIVTLSFPFGNADRAPDVAKAMAEYVEGTYVEGVVPGFTYRPPVSELLDHARQGEGDDSGNSGPMPL